MRKTRSLSLEPRNKVPAFRRFLAILWCIIANWDLFMLALEGQIRQFFFPGTPKTRVRKKIREDVKNLNIMAKASIAKINPEALLFEIHEALRETINAIEGFAFLSRPIPQNPCRNRSPDEHTVLIKIGVNWGLGGYPTVTSSESIYAVTRLCLEEAAKQKKKIEIIVGDESGIEVRRMGKTTRENFVNVGVFAAAESAALHYAAAMEKQGNTDFDGAGALVKEMGVSYGFDVEQFHAMPQDRANRVKEMARKAGIRVLPFDESEKVLVCPSTPHREKVKRSKDGSSLPKEVKHFKVGFLIPKVVAEEVTDIINLPKPPGRHSILGNAGLTGALKNYVGLMDGDQQIPKDSHSILDRLINGLKNLFSSKDKDKDKEREIPNLHGGTDRFRRPKKDQNDKHLGALGELAKDITRFKKGERRITPSGKFPHSSVLKYKFKRAGSGKAFYEKIAEIYLAFANPKTLPEQETNCKERFCVTDMRRTMSSIGPDFGDNIDIGAVIAASDALTLDAIAGAFLKKRYKEIGGFWEAVKIGGDSLLEFLAGLTWLEKKTSPFDLMAHLAANSYGLGPIDLDHIEFEGLENSGFRVSEIEELAEFLRDGRRSVPAKPEEGKEDQHRVHPPLAAR